jgi:hypothetical protein
MYTIRAQHGGLLDTELSGRLTTTEALRAVSQSFALAEADGITRAVFDVRGVERGPGNLLLVAAAFASRYQRGMRVALVSRPEQFGLVQRFARYTGARAGVGAFVTPEAAADWLDSEAVAPRLSSTELRHLADLARQWAPRAADPAADKGRRSGAA